MSKLVDKLRALILGSDRWLAVTEQLNVLVVAKVGRLRVENWTGAEAEEVMAWCAGETPLEPMPRVLATWLEKVRRAS